MSSPPRYRVTLTQAERDHLESLGRFGRGASKKLLAARMFLLCDRGPHGPDWPVAEVAQAVGRSVRTVERCKKRFVEEGLEAALRRKPQCRPSREIIFDGQFEARLLALACCDAPEGFARWTLRLLADKVVELGFAPSVSPMTVHRLLKKTLSSPI